MNSKTCTKCRVAKPLTDFYAAKAMKDGRASWCKKCSNARKRDPQQRAAYQKTYRQRPIALAREQERGFQRRYGISSR